MKTINIITLLIVSAAFILNISACAQKEEHIEEHTEHSAEAKAAIDVKAVDKNEDGKVLMCPMFCTDLVTDEDARCPKCEMKLTEYSIADAEMHLKDKGHKVEEHDSHSDHDM